MASSTLTVPYCFGCSAPFDLAEHAPRFLPCAHSICSDCAENEKMNTNKKKNKKKSQKKKSSASMECNCCPYCEQEFDPLIALLTVDEALTALLESRVDRDGAEKEVGEDVESPSAKRVAISCDDCGEGEAVAFCDACPDKVSERVRAMAAFSFRLFVAFEK
jgi:hypothetical protein